MSKSAPRVRHRCVECRCWFEPAATATQHQKVCSPECRKARRNGRARERRGQNLEGYRKGERDRQREHRAEARRKAPPSDEAAEAPPGPAPPRVSRAGLGAELLEIVEKVLEYLDTEVSRSRTGLRRQVMKILQELGPSRRQESRPETRCHGPP